MNPNIQAVCTQEKEQIKTLNNRFASFINQMWSLKQKNKILETKWNFLQQQKTIHSNMENMFESDINNLPRQEKLRLKAVWQHAEAGGGLEEYVQGFV